MRRQGHTKLFIWSVVAWHSLAGCVIPLLWDSFLRLLGQALPIAKIIHTLRGQFCSRYCSIQKGTGSWTP